MFLCNLFVDRIFDDKFDFIGSTFVSFLYFTEQNKTTSAVVSLLFNLDYNVYVQGKEDKLKQ